MSELPNGWAETELSELVGTAHTGLVRSAKEQSDDFEFPYLKMNNLSISGRFLLDKMTKVNATPIEVDKFTLERGDFLFNTRNSVELVGKCGVYQGSIRDQILFNNNLLKIKFLIVFPEIIAYWFNSALGKKQLSEIISATTSVAAIYQKSLMTRRVPIPPLAEQKRIVEKLDGVLAQVDTIKARLDGIPDLLKRFRQSVLASAVSGELTEEWRGGIDLQKVLTHRYEEFKAGSIDGSPSTAQKNKLIKIHQQDENQEFVFEVPNGWLLKNLNKIAFGFNYGSSAKSQSVGNVPVLRMGNIQRGKLIWEDLVYTSDSDEVEKYRLVKGDVLFNRTNSPELVGKTTIYRGEQEAIYAGYLIKVQGSALLNPEFLNIALNSQYAKNYCLSVKTDGVSQSNINAQKLGAFPCPLPPIEEQNEIVRLVEQYFAFADTIEAQVKKAQARVDNLTQSILAKAFRGELVPQDPNDEPADKLLERIAKARSEAEALAKAAKKAEAAKKRAAKA